MAVQNIQWLSEYDPTLQFDDSGSSCFNHDDLFDVFLHLDDSTLIGVIPIIEYDGNATTFQQALAWNFQHAPFNTSLAFDAESGWISFKLFFDNGQLSNENKVNTLVNYIDAARQIHQLLHSNDFLFESSAATEEPASFQSADLMLSV
ncbi:hypothetical protein [Thalassomonas sp. RHCl1]|uniref:hypothetical protein n=1 Tax=Thalassomonas sp. RHCl1 TaxID=2995320 RepID=UPI00248BDF82|nr:hypothetical protein [Thalassomonas sp. RHCl1]